MTELVLGDGPARYLGGSIETFALPRAAFIVIAGALYVIFTRFTHPADKAEGDE